jgi:hypothetical protein
MTLLGFQRLVDICLFSKVDDVNLQSHHDLSSSGSSGNRFGSNKLNLSVLSERLVPRRWHTVGVAENNEDEGKSIRKRRR